MPAPEVAEVVGAELHAPEAYNMDNIRVLTLPHVFSVSTGATKRLTGVVAQDNCVELVAVRAQGALAAGAALAEQLPHPQEAGAAWGNARQVLPMNTMSVVAPAYPDM